MARYEHLPIFREAYDLTVHIEKIVRNFSRYHKYTLGTDLRNRSRKILEKIMEANNAGDRLPCLLGLRHELESLKIMTRLCHESGGFASTRSYLYMAERITNIAKQNESFWLRSGSISVRKLRGKVFRLNTLTRQSVQSEHFQRFGRHPCLLPNWLILYDFSGTGKHWHHYCISNNEGDNKGLKFHFSTPEGKPDFSCLQTVP